MPVEEALWLAGLLLILGGVWGVTAVRGQRREGLGDPHSGGGQPRPGRAACRLTFALLTESSGGWGPSGSRYWHNRHYEGSI